MSFHKLEETNSDEPRSENKFEKVCKNHATKKKATEFLFNCKKSRRGNKKVAERRPIEKVNEIKDGISTQQTVITVKKDRSVKSVLEAINQAIDTDKYQMPKLDGMVNMVAEKLDSKKGAAGYPSVDMLSAFGQFQFPCIYFLQNLHSK